MLGGAFYFETPFEFEFVHNKEENNKRERKRRKRERERERGDRWDEGTQSVPRSRTTPTGPNIASEYSNPILVRYSTVLGWLVGSPLVVFAPGPQSNLLHLALNHPTHSLQQPIQSNKGEERGRHTTLYYTIRSYIIISCTLPSSVFLSNRWFHWI